MIVDCTHIPTGPLNRTLDELCKSVEEAGLLQPHPTSRLLAAMEQATTEDVQVRVDGILVLALRAFGLGGHTRELVKAAPDDLGPKCRKLERKLTEVEPGTLSLETYLDVIDCWLWRYLPPALAAQQAQRRAVQQYLVGLSRYAADVHEAAVAVALVATLPTTRTQARDRFPLTTFDEARIRIAEASAGRNIQSITARTRTAIQDVLINAERRRVATGQEAYDPRPLEQQLRDTFADLNRDWRRIAVTETATHASEAYLSRFAPGAKVRWLAHPGACRYCESQHGKVFTVVAPDKAHKDPETEVWVGKQAENIGRAIAKRKRLENGEVVARTADELVIPAIPSHANCRCLYVPVSKE